MNRDWITNEIFRRVEPTGRTMGEFFRDELMVQHDLDIFINMKKSELHKVYDIALTQKGTQLSHLMSI